MRRALEEPLRQIVGNAGEEGAVVVGKIRDSKDPNYGYNAQTGEFEDLVKAGVIDPTKVTRTALQNAASIAGSDADHRSSCRPRFRKTRRLRQCAAATAAAWATCTKNVAQTFLSGDCVARDTLAPRKRPTRESGPFAF